MIQRRLIVSVPINRLKFNFIKSQGPGGQNVNKTNSKAQLSVDLTGGWISAEMIESIRKLKNGGILNLNSTRLVIQSDSHRSQLQNQQDCQRKLSQILQEAEEDCKPEREPSKAQVERVEGLKKEFDSERRLEKQKIREKKTSRNLKSNWKNQQD